MGVLYCHWLVHGELHFNQPASARIGRTGRAGRRTGPDKFNQYQPIIYTVYTHYNIYIEAYSKTLINVFGWGYKWN